jgi:hypothetical protein
MASCSDTQQGRRDNRTFRYGEFKDLHPRLKPSSLHNAIAGDEHLRLDLVAVPKGDSGRLEKRFRRTRQARLQGGGGGVLVELGREKDDHW